MWGKWEGCRQSLLVKTWKRVEPTYLGIPHCCRSRCHVDKCWEIYHDKLGKSTWIHMFCCNFSQIVETGASVSGKLDQSPTPFPSHIIFLNISTASYHHLTTTAGNKSWNGCKTQELIFSSAKALCLIEFSTAFQWCGMNFNCSSQGMSINTTES